MRFDIASTIIYSLYIEIKSKLRSIVFNQSNFPWMKYKEVILIEEIIQSLDPIKCLEWGCGYGTSYFINLIKPNSTWLSIESSENWGKKIKALVKNNNFDLRIYPFGENDKENNNIVNYIESPIGDGNFDFILIDGQYRHECLFTAVKVMSNKSVIIVHDYNRSDFHDMEDHFKYTAIFKDHREYSGGMLICSNNIDVKSIINFQYNMDIWNLCSGPLRILRL